MADYHLPAYEGIGLHTIAELRSGVLDGSMTLSSLLKIGEAYRTVAATALLLHLDGKTAMRWLACSGQAFLAAIKQKPDLCPPTGRAFPMRDAIASGDVELAREIAKRLPMTWRTDEEFEDEYCFHAFLIARFLLEDATLATASLATLAACDETREDGRLALCQALQLGDFDLFATGMATLLQAHRDHYDDLTEREAVSDDVLCTQGPICFDGLAMVRLAQMAGIKVASEYPGIPGFAITASAGNFSKDGWRVTPPVS